MLENSKTLKIRGAFITPVLATTPGNKEIYKDYICSKGTVGKTGEELEKARKNKEEELENFDNFDEETLEKATTYFPLDKDGDPIMYTYQIEGFLKSACGALKRIPGTLSSKVKAYKKEIDLLMFAMADANDPSKREIKLKSDGEMEMFERPLRASTPQGERVALARSQSLPAGTTFEFDLLLLRGEQDIECVKEMLDYAKLEGFLQWRNSGMGRANLEIIEEGGKKKKRANKK